MAVTFTRAQVAATDRKKFTFSCWLKRGKLTTQENFFTSIYNASNEFQFRFDSDDEIRWAGSLGGSAAGLINTKRLFRDTNGWYNIVIVGDTTQATNIDRLKLYINGEQVADGDLNSPGYPAQDTDFGFGTTDYNFCFGVSTPGTTNDPFTGLMSYAAFVDGTAYDASYFGETDSSSGIWKIKTAPSVTYGNNGFYLKMDTASPTTDSSGNNNTFSSTGTPTLTQDNASNNFAVFNPIANGGTNLTITNCNTTVYDSDSTWRSGFGGLAPSSGKWYFEAKRVGSSSNAWVGIMDSSQLDGTGTYKLTAKSRGYGYSASGEKGNSGSESAWGNAYAQNDIVGVAMDLDNQKIYFSKNGTWENSGVPTSGSTGTGSMYDLASGYNYYPATSLYSTSAGFSFNFGNGFFGETAVTSSNADAAGHGLMEYAVPSGYYTLNTKNLNTYG
jgi:hypothetical protein|tara:strand:- start:4566 stop:5897 length:1332 start_codon:yes stop_codon:yes gene_type:complete